MLPIPGTGRNEAIMLFMHKQRPALARVVRNSNAVRFAPEHDDPGSTLDEAMDRIRDIPPSAMSRLSGSLTVFAR